MKNRARHLDRLRLQLSDVEIQWLRWEACLREGQAMVDAAREDEMRRRRRSETIDAAVVAVALVVFIGSMLWLLFK